MAGRDDSHFCSLEFIPQAIEGLQLMGLTHLRNQFFKKRGIGKGEWFGALIHLF